MVSTIASTLPLALGIALNPVAVIAGILILRGPDSRRNGVAYLGGWILGLALLLAVATGLVQVQLGFGRGAVSRLPSIVWVASGAALLAAAAWRVVRGRPLPGAEPELPRPIRFLHRAGPAKALGAGTFLAAVSLRNLALIAAAAGAIGSGTLGFLERAIAVAVFVAAGSIGILAPVLLRVIGGDSADAVLAAWGAWLTRNMGMLTAVVMGVLGLYLLGKGLTGFG